MFQINCMIKMWKKAFKIYSWYFIFPFTIVAFCLTLVFFVLAPLYMWIDYLSYRIKQLLNDNNKVSEDAQIIKYVYIYFFYFIFAVISIIFSTLLAMLHFLTNICLCVSSCFKFKENPFIYHTEFE